ncbi:phage protein NinX family protein [Enterobacter hormaechei]|uniref:phage protein NinX family protein n=1 Tax=Enterobacter hormaechei TaxID=158836 RepID=UPI0034CE1A67
MDYSKLSDFEINKRVSICIHPDIKNWNCYDVSGRACFVINEGTPKRVQYGFSFTSDPANAWPIIVGHKLSLINADNEWLCVPDDTAVDGTTGDDVQMIYSGDGHVHANPLRAAMVVFLTLQDSANVQDNPA